MFDREKAAQYFVVAWVKNWKFYTYLHSVGVHGMDYSLLHDIYPWLPSQNNLHYLIKNTHIRPWIARSMKVINDRLWDTDDNKKRLEIAKQIEMWDADNVLQTKKEKDDYYEYRKANKDMIHHQKEYRVSRSLKRQGAGHHWKVCK